MALRTCPINAAAGAPLPMTSPTLKKTESSLEHEHVVPVAPGVGAGHARPILGVEQKPFDLGQGLRQHGALEHLGDHVLTLEARGVRQGDPGPACHLGGQRHVVASKTRPGPSMKVITPITSPLAVSGTASAVDGASVGRALLSGDRGAPAVCAPSGRPLRPAPRSRRGTLSIGLSLGRRRSDIGLGSSFMSRRTSPLSLGTSTMHESASLPSTRLMVRRMTVVGSRLELRSRVTSDKSESRSRADLGSHAAPPVRVRTAGRAPAPGR